MVRRSGESPIGSGAAGLRCQNFGGHISALSQNWLKGYGSSTTGGTTDISQLSAWIVPEDITLEHLALTTFVDSPDGTAVIGIFLEDTPAPFTTVTMDDPQPLPDGGAYQVMDLGGLVVPAGSVVTVRQMAGQLLSFSSPDVWYR